MRKTIILLIKFYKIFLSPFLVLVFGHGCKFTPTCSDYAEVAIERFGILRGSLLAMKRIVRCHPFAKGGWDPIETQSANLKSQIQILKLKSL